MKDLRVVSFGCNICRVRKQKGLSQEALAEMAGIDRSYMGHIERGEKNISLIKIYQISDALGVHPSSLFVKDITESGS